MTSLMILMTLFITIATILLLLNFLISKKYYNNREKMSPFECGFDPNSKNRIPFSIQFFLISLIFLIFDIEITLLLPLVLTMKFLNSFMIYMIIMSLILLLMGIYMEFLEKSLNWKK